MLYGIGSVGLCTTELDANSIIGQNVFAEQCIAALSLTPENQSEEAQCYVEGQLQTKASRITTNNWIAEVTYEFVDWATLQITLGELAKTGAANVPTLKTVTGVATIIETDVNTTNNNVESLKLYNATEGAFMTLVVGAPGVNEYSIVADGTDVDITLNAAQVGQAITYTYNKVYTSIESIGAPGATDYIDDFSLSGIVSSAVEGSEAYVIVADRITRRNFPTIAFTGGTKAVLTIQYRILTAPGEVRPFRLYRLEGAVAA